MQKLIFQKFLTVACKLPVIHALAASIIMIRHRCIISRNTNTTESHRRPWLSRKVFRLSLLRKIEAPVRVIQTVLHNKLLALFSSRNRFELLGGQRPSIVTLPSAGKTTPMTRVTYSRLVSFDDSGILLHHTCYVLNPSDTLEVRPIDARRFVDEFRKSVSK